MALILFILSLYCLVGVTFSALGWTELSFDHPVSLFWVAVIEILAWPLILSVVVYLVIFKPKTFLGKEYRVVKRKDRFW